MSVSSIQGAIERIQRDIERLHRQQVDTARDEAAKNERISQTARSITSTTSASTAQSKRREIQRLESDLIAIQRRRADLTKKIADKTGALHKEQQNLYKEQEREQKTYRESLERRDREMRSKQDDMLRRLATPPQFDSASATDAHDERRPSYDAFISHATEDKAALARPLAERLRDLGLAVWYDEFELSVGDSLRRAIDRGLASSRFGIVVLSPAFFEKNWPQYELDGLVAREMTGGKVILPLWHKISKDEVISYSPSLADKVALNTAMYSIEELAVKLVGVIAPEV